MKRYFFTLALFASALFFSCETEDALTPNEDFQVGATGDNPDPGADLVTNDSTTIVDTTGGGSNGITLPQDFNAPTVPSNRVAVLEDFTGVRCGFCPQGHDIASGIESSLGDDFIVIAVHASGTYSQPQPGTDWPNFETPFGDAIKNQADPSGFPAGSVNRLAASAMNQTPQRPNGMAMGRGSWSNAANHVISESSPVNVGVSASVDNRDLTVIVDLYYTEDETSTNHINVALLQNGLVGRQSGGNPDPMNYTQNHVLRALIAGDNPQWGDPVVEPTTKDSFVRKTYTYTIPNDYNGVGADGGGEAIISNMEVVAFVTRGQTDILSADITSLP